MPFDRFAPCSFSLVSVLQNAPALPGVYGLSNSREWIFVGGAENIQVALLSHLRGTHTALLERGPTGFVFELCHPASQSARQEQLIREYEPICNPGAV